MPTTPMKTDDRPKLINSIDQFLRRIVNHFVKPGLTQYFWSGRSASIANGATGTITYTQIAFDFLCKSICIKSLNVSSAYALINGVTVQMIIGTEKLWPTQVESSFFAHDGFIAKNMDKGFIIRRGTNVSLEITNNSGQTVQVDSILEGYIKKTDFDNAL